MYLTEVQKIGIGLLGIGALFVTFGILMLFDKGLMIIGNLMIVAGSLLFFGLQKSRDFLFCHQRVKGTACFVAGLFLILIRWPKIGFLLEVFGWTPSESVSRNLMRKFFLNKPSAPANASTVDAKCQKCLQHGHWTADCTNERIYKSRPSRTSLLLNPKLKRPEESMDKTDFIEDEPKRATLKDEPPQNSGRPIDADVFADEIISQVKREIGSPIRERRERNRSKSPESIQKPRELRRQDSPSDSDADAKVHFENAPKSERNFSLKSLKNSEHRKHPNYASDSDFSSDSE